MNKKIPILLVTGFLGSGKTTFINWLLKSKPNTNISLILNEFGDIQLESQFIEKNGETEVAELANGCMCCVAKSDIPRVIDIILKDAPHTEYIVIEASGLSDPDPIYASLQSEELSSKVTLETILCIVDAVNFEKNRQEHAIVMSQVGDAHLILLSKIKEAGAEATAKLKAFIERIGVGTKVALWDENLDPDLFLRSNTQPNQAKTEHEHDHQHEHYDEFWFKSDKQIDQQKFTEVMKNLPANIVRSKGFINVDGKKMMVQYIPNDFKLLPADWGNQSPTTAVLFLGKEINETDLEAKLELCQIITK